jgi:hypothetical protein
LTGWIKLHRAIMKSETFSKLTATQRLITIYIILNANHEDGIWFDKYKNIEVPVKRGQLIVSRSKITNEWFKGDKEITEQKVRTTLKKLEKLSFLTSTSTSNYTLLEVLNYNVYQANQSEDNQVSNQVLTRSQPSTNQVLTTNKNVKNDKNDKNDKNEKKENSPKQVYDESSLYFRLSTYFFERILENNPEFKKPDLQKWADDFRLIIERDKRNEEQIKQLIDYCQQDSFWKANILSPSKLRKQFDRLIVKIKEEKQTKQKSPQNFSLERPKHWEEPKPLTKDEYCRMKEAEAELPY